jgi:uncharacterized protein YbjQ (UPF0145 family)
MILTTTPSVEGRAILEYKALVTGETIIGANIFRDFFAGIRDIVGGRSASYEKVLREAKDIAIQEMIERAKSFGADAIVGIDLDYETMGEKNGMMMVTASGTAVKLA